MIGEKSSGELTPSNIDPELPIHGPNLCQCKIADECPYWKKKLDKADLSMNRGLSLGGETSNLIYVGSTDDLDKFMNH